MNGQDAGTGPEGLELPAPILRVDGECIVVDERALALGTPSTDPERIAALRSLEHDPVFGASARETLQALGLAVDRVATSAHANAVIKSSAAMLSRMTFNNPAAAETFLRSFVAQLDEASLEDGVEGGSCRRLGG